MALSHSFLPTDPRREVIIRYTTNILEDDLSSFWAGLTEPEVLANRLWNLRKEGLSYVEMTKAIDTQYRSGFYRAERLVRSAYNSSANHAAYQDLLDTGFDRGQWLTARDSRVRKGGPNRADHRAMDGQTRKLGEPFVTLRGHRLLFPGDRSLGAPADEVVNCRCVIVGA